MRGNARHHAGIVQTPDIFDRRFHDPGFRLELRMITAVDHTVGKTSSDAGFVNGASHRLHLKVHIVEGRGPGPDHLQAGEFCPPVDIVFCEVRLCRPDLGGKPLKELHIIRISPKKTHRGVGVHIYHTGKCGRPVPVDNELCVVIGDLFSDRPYHSCAVEVDLLYFSVQVDVSDENRDLFSKDVCVCHASFSTIFVMMAVIRSPFCFEIETISS